MAVVDLNVEGRLKSIGRYVVKCHYECSRLKTVDEGVRLKSRRVLFYGINDITIDKALVNCTHFDDSNNPRKNYTVTVYKNHNVRMSEKGCSGHQK